MDAYFGYARLLATGAPAPGATVTVYSPPGSHGLATIYADNLSPATPKANPFVADAASGFFQFYAPSGRYDIKLSGGGIVSPYTWGDVPIGFGTSVLKASTTWDPAPIPIGGYAATTVPVSGASVGDPCIAGFSTINTQGVGITANVNQIGLVTVNIVNGTAGALDLASGTLNVMVFPYGQA